MNNPPAQVFKKSEIKTIEELFNLIVETANIHSKPVCESVDFIWNWRDHIGEHLLELGNHSFYNAFCIKRELSESSGWVTKLRVKRLPQDEVWEPPTGLQLLKSGFSPGPVPVAEYKIESLQMDREIIH